MITEVFETESGRVSLGRLGAGPDLVLLHSLMANRHIFDPVVPRLAEDWRVNVVDLPGFGATSLVPRGIDNYAAMMAGVLDVGGFDPATTALVGNGLGAFVALGTAIHHGVAFDKLVLVGCGAWFPEEAKGAFEVMAGKVRADGMEAVLDQAVARLFTPEFLDRHPEVGEERRSVLRETDPAAFERACLSLVDLDYREPARTVRNPTLVVVGSDDQATPPSLGSDLAERIPGAAYRELPGIAHAPQLQDPEGFISAITPFLGAGGP